MVKTYSELYQSARKQLLPTEGENAANMARELLCAAADRSAEEIIANRDLYASEEVDERLQSYLQRAINGEPLAYILGQWSFYGMELTVTPDVLIPRDDTLAVAELAVKRALFLPQNPRILDLCTGSGCIGLAIAKRVKDARVTMGDISPAALRVARKNITDQHLAGRVSCITIDALKPATKFLGTFDMIVSNPPYVTTAEMETLEHSVRDFEPHLALHGGEDGLDFYRAILQNYTSALAPEGYLLFEFGMGQEDAVGELLRQFDYDIMEWKQDAREILRAVAAKKKEGI